MLATMITRQWVKLDPKSDSRYKFEGGLIRITEGLDGIADPFNPVNSSIDVSDSSFIRISCASGFLIDIWNKDTTNEQQWNFYSSWEKMFDDLWFAGGFFLAFELQALVCIVIVIVTLILIFKERFYLGLNFCASVCLWLSHVIAIMGWIGLLDVTFSDDCEELNDEDEAPTLCATTGPRLGIFVLVLLPFIMIPYFVVFCFFRRAFVRPKIAEFNASLEGNNITHVTDGPPARAVTKAF
jgi:hypothetical protein